MNTYEIIVMNDGYGWFEVRAVNAKAAEKEVSDQIAASGKDGWDLVNEDALVMEVERVYATRYDCNNRQLVAA